MRNSNPRPSPHNTKSTQLNPLIGSEQEAIAIGNLLKTKPDIGPAATETAIRTKLPSASIIHLATHGLFDFKQQETDIPGAIALAPTGITPETDGFLTASEIFDMKLTANLVILSACDTARGDITGDGVIGLSRSLISAGVPSVIVSLWAVPDAPTADLMTEFYRNLTEKKLDKAQSLRQAMLHILNNPKTKDPSQWAAFTLIGEAQ